MGWLIERITHHSMSGQFCGAGSASTVTKDGERYKVVRQHRKMGGKKKCPKVADSVLAQVEAAQSKSAAARARGRLTGWVSMHEVLNAS